MKTAHKILLISATTLTIQSCVLAPLSNNYTARTLGKGNWDVSGGASAVNMVQPYARVGIGVTDNLDAGVVGEYGNSTVGGIWTKYSLINNPTALSFAAIGGAGYTGEISFKHKKTNAAGSFYFYGGPIVSYKLGWWEPYVIARYNYLTINVSYGQLTVGNTIWLTDKLGLNIDGSALVGVGTGFFGSGGLVYRF